jgi:hypothetical protein
MRRRKIVKGFGITAGSVFLAGCSDIMESAGFGEQSDLEITDTDAQTTTFGNVRVGVMVANRGEKSGSATLVGQVDVQGGDTYTKRRDISVPAGDSNSYTLEFDIDLTESLSADRFQYSARLE